MRVLFVYSLYNIATIDKPLRSPELIQFGISYISAYLKIHGHSTELVVLSRLSGNKNQKIIDECMERFKPDIVAFTAITSEFEFIRSIAQYIRGSYPELHLSIGGYHASLNPDGLLEDFDSLCIGEGEIPMLELVRQLEADRIPSGIPNLWLKNNGRIEKNPTRPFLQDLDVLPFPDRQIWQRWIQNGPGARHAVLLGRGCPFDCTYCCNHALKKVAQGRYSRFRSPENVIEEIQDIALKYPLNNEIYLEVESIGIDKEWAIKLCEKLFEFNKNQAQPFSFGVNLRITPNNNLKDIFPEFKKANIKFVNIGLESGCAKVRSEVLNRYYSNEDIFEAVKLAKGHGLQVCFLNMVGLPGETEDDFRETIEMNRKCQPDWTSASIFYPSPGTALHSFCMEKGLIGGRLPTEMERSRAVMDLPGFTKRRIEKHYAWFEYNVYKGKRPLAQLLLKTLRLRIESNPALFCLYRRTKRLLGR